MVNRQWDHMQIHVRHLKEDHLAELGADGWELVAVDDNTAWFKRPRACGNDKEES
jgi:hypothetical protein